MTHPTDALRLVPSRDDGLTVGRAILEAHSQWEKEHGVTGSQNPWQEPHIILLGQAAILAAPASPLPEGGGWQDISTAPKDGTCFLWCCLDDLDGNAGMHVVFWDHGEFRYASDHEKFVGDPVDSWMPLPAAPTGDAK